MNKKPAFALIILTFNEIEGLNRIFDQIPIADFDEVIAVDGGSTDGTIEFFQSRQIPVIIQTQKGRGVAFQLAHEKTQAPFLIFFSPDGNEDPGDLSKFKEYFSYDNPALIIASRMLANAHNEEDALLFKWRKWANQVFNWLANLFFRTRGPFVTDSINGYRGISRSAFGKIKPDATGYAIEYQMTIRALKHKLKIMEFPTHEGNRIGGESYAKSIPTGLQFLKILIKEIFHA